MDKKCNCCGEVKDVSLFAKGHKDVITNFCKICNAAKVKAKVHKTWGDTKMCLSCNVDKNLSEFEVSGTGKKGRVDYCNFCLYKFRKCTTCDKILSIDEFHKSSAKKFGYKSECKDCFKKYPEKYIKNNLEAIKKSNPIESWCSDCKKFLSCSKFSKSKLSKTGCFHLCKLCHKKIAIVQRVKNKERMKTDLVYATRRRLQKLISSRRREIRKRNTNTDVRLKTIEAEFLIDHWNRRCAYCNGDYQQLDHVNPIAKDGSHSLDNILPSCRRCNFSKHTSYIDEFGFKPVFSEHEVYGRFISEVIPIQ